MRQICDVAFNNATPIAVLLAKSGIFPFKVDLYSGCDSDATSNTIVAMEKRYYCEIIAFLSHRYYRF
jgi:hypothetical protein